MADVPVPLHPQLKFVYDKLQAIGNPNALEALLTPIPPWGKLLIQATWMLLKYQAVRADRTLNMPDDTSAEL